MKQTRKTKQNEDISGSIGPFPSGSLWKLKSNAQKLTGTKRIIFEGGGFLLGIIFEDIGWLAWLLGSAYIDHAQYKNKDQ